MLEHELIQTEFHSEPEQIRSFYRSIGINKRHSLCRDN